MSVRIFSDIEEALSRETRRITHHDSRTVSDTVLQDTFDPFTGNVVQVPIEPQFYDSSADTRSIGFPNVFIKLLRSREDRFSGKVVPQYGKYLTCPVEFAPKAFEIIAGSSDGDIDPGSDLITSLLQIGKVQVGYLLRILNGNNTGTYVISSVTLDAGGSHQITADSTLATSLPSFTFDPITRFILFSDATDLSAVRVGDDFTDNSSGTETITAVDPSTNTIVLGGVSTPDTDAGATISRTGDVFVDDTVPIRYIVLDPSKPITVNGDYGSSSYMNVSPAIPLDLFYLIRIDSKERQTHIEILNRMWEEFNPPRAGLPVIVRTKNSAEALLTADVTLGGSDTIDIDSNSGINIGDKVFLHDDISPSKDLSSEGYQRPFESKVIAKISTDQVVLEDIVPDTYTLSNCSKLTTNANVEILMFHFVDHKTRDIEGAQYWVHEFTFWVQAFIDRLADDSITVSAITEIKVEDPELEIDPC